MSNVSPPSRLNHQNAVGTTLLRSRSLAIHCRMKRVENNAWPRKPTASHTVGMVMFKVGLLSRARPR